MKRQFPIMRNYSRRAQAPGAVEPRKSIPWAMLAPHEDRAMRNHGQTLERLAQRGGLAPCEALWILRDERWGGPIPADEDAQLDALVAEFEKAQADNGAA